MTKRIHHIFSFVTLSVLLTYVVGCGQTAVTESTDTDTSSNTSGISAVSDLAAVPSLTEIALTWTNPNYDGSYYIRVQYKKALETDYQIAATLSEGHTYKITDLASVQEYNIRVQTITADGKSSSYSKELQVTTEVTNTEPDLKYPVFDTYSTSFVEYNLVKTIWTWSEADLSNVSSIDVYRKKYSASDWGTVIATIKPTDKAFTDRAYSENPQANVVAYRFAINYVKGTSEPANMEPAKQTYALPQVTAISPSVSGTDIKLGLTWSYSNHSNSVKSFEVQRKKINDTIYTTLSTVIIVNAALPDSFTDDTITYVDGAVTYRVIVHYNNTFADFVTTDSSSISVPTPPMLTDPTNVLSSISSKTISVTWNYPIALSNVEFHIEQIFEKSDGSFPIVVPSTIVYSPGTGSYSMPSLNLDNSACQAPNVVSVEITVQAAAIDENKNLDSNVKSAGAYTCDGLML